LLGQKSFLSYVFEEAIFSYHVEVFFEQVRNGFDRGFVYFRVRLCEKEDSKG
jgi:hypothetical protein